MRGLLLGFQLAVRAIVRNPLRTSLTVLGILIGVMAVGIVTALGTGARTSVASQIESLGSNFVIIFPQTANASGARGMQGQGPRLTEEDARAIMREAVSVVATAPALRARAQIVHMDRNASTTVVGTLRPFFQIRNWRVASGEPWEEHDELLRSKKVVIGNTVRRKLFGNLDPVGRNVRIGRYAYTVVGVLEAKGEAPFGGDQDDIVLMPIASMRARVMRTAPGNAGVIMASASSKETTEGAVRQINAILRQRHRLGDAKEADFSVSTQKEFQAVQETVYALLTLLLVLMAAVSLLVGGIGVMNIMLVSVAERTREIGIRMAIGAREGDIRVQFLVEAILLSLLGGLSGAVLAAAISAGVTAAFDFPMKLSWFALTISVATSVLTGIFFGYFPAQRAARLDPIVALRYE